MQTTTQYASAAARKLSHPSTRLARRRLLQAGLSLAATSALAQSPAAPGTPAYFVPLGNALPDWPAIRNQLGGRTPKHGRVQVEAPPFAENGNSVPVAITIQSSMTAAEHVRMVWLFPERNPRPTIATFNLGPDNGRAQIDSRIRLAGTQNMIALAEFSDNSLWWGSAHVVVTIAACLEGG